MEIGSVLRCADQEASGNVAFSPGCLAALQQMFDHFDTDGDTVLDFEEAAALFRFTDDQQLSREQFEALREVVETDARGNITFTGMVDLYRVNYSDEGTAAGDKTLWKDLALFGFDATLQRDESIALPERAKKKQNAFVFMRKKAEARRKEKLEPQSVALSVSKGPVSISEVEHDDVEMKLQMVTTGEKDDGKRNAFDMLQGSKGKDRIKQKKKVVVIDPEETSRPVAKPTVVPDEEVHAFFKPRSSSSRRVYALDETKSEHHPIVVDMENEDDIVDVDFDNIATEWFLPDFPVDETRDLRKTENDLFPKPNLDNQSFNFDRLTFDESINHTVTQQELNFTTPNYAWQHIFSERMMKDETTFMDLLLPLAKEMMFPREVDTNKLCKYVQARLDRNFDASPWTNRYMNVYCEYLFLRDNEAMIEVETWLSEWMERTRRPKKKKTLKTLMKPKKEKKKKWSSRDDDNDSDEDCWWDGDELVLKTAAHIFVGPSGSGKTSIVYHIAEKLGLKVMEVHPGNIRSNSNMRSKIGETMQSRVIGELNTLNDSVILIDEADIVFDDDKGFFSFVKHLIETARCPVILTCNNLPLELMELSQQGAVVHYLDAPCTDQIVQVLQYICLVQGVEASDNQLRYLIRERENDIRSCLCQLQFFNDYQTYQELDEKFQSMIFQTPKNSLELFQANNGAMILDAILNTKAKAEIEEEEPKRPPLPQVHTVKPNQGSFEGGTIIEVSGVDLWCEDAVSVEVDIDGVPCEELIVVGKNKLRVKVPAMHRRKNCPEQDELLAPTTLKEEVSAPKTDEEEDTEELEDEIEFSDEEPLVTARKQKGKRLPPGRRFAWSQLWPSDVNVSLRLKNGLRLSSNMDLQYAHNGLFHYLPVRKSQQETIFGALTNKNEGDKTVVKEVANTTSKGTNTAALKDQDSVALSEMLEVLETFSFGDSISSHHEQHHTNFALDYSNIYEDEYRHVVMDSICSMKIRQYDDITLQPCTLKTGDRRAFFCSAMRVLSTDNIVPLLSLGPSRKAGLVNNHGIHPSFRDYLPYLCKYAAIDAENQKEAPSRRRYMTHFSRNGNYQTEEAVSQHRNRFPCLYQGSN